MSDDEPYRCEGCELPRNLSYVEMVYGETEWLCDECISQSWDVIRGGSNG